MPLLREHTPSAHLAALQDMLESPICCCMFQMRSPPPPPLGNMELKTKTPGRHGKTSHQHLWLHLSIESFKNVFNQRTHLL